MKNNKIFLCGFVYDTTQMTAEEIKADIERHFNEYYGGKAVSVDLKIEDSKVDLTMHRCFNDNVGLPYNTFGGGTFPSIFCIDQDFILGNRLEGNVCKESNGGYGFGYLGSDYEEDFFDIYRKNCKILKVRKPKKLDFKGTSESFTFSINNN